MFKNCFSIVFLLSCLGSNSQELIDVGYGWAGNSINTVVFRKNSITGYKDTQFIAYYDTTGYMVIGKRNLNEKKWILHKTKYKGKITDAHNSISIAVDGQGYLHVAWDHHNSTLRYSRSVMPGSLELTTEMPMTGLAEKVVSYPEFYNLPNGNLLFFYRDGSSGSGNLVLNTYDIHAGQWKQLHSNLIDGEKIRNAYWQACVDPKGSIHLSWTWRETPDVASNHDLCYARSDDGGINWKKSTGEVYHLPIKAADAEYACRIPQASELINQTSMAADEEGNPFIATYWKPGGSTVPQYHIVYKTGNEWQVKNLGFRTTPFTLSGVGTKRIPISRPQVIVWKNKKKAVAMLIFRDAERGNKVSVALTKNLKKNKWNLFDLSARELGSWEPTYDADLWKQKKEMHLFVQKTEQTDSEGISQVQPQMISVLEWKMLKN